MSDTATGNTTPTGTDVGKIMGILALIVALISIFVPDLGIYLCALSGILAAMSAGSGFIFGAVAIGVNFINIAFFSPFLWQEMTGGSSGLDFFAVETSWRGIPFASVQVVALVYLVLRHKKLQEGKGS